MRCDHDDIRSYREDVRSGLFDGPTSGMLRDHVQANLVVLPAAFATEFAAFCARNPRPCPVLDISEPGEVSAGSVAPDADLRTDVPRYRIWHDGQLVDEVTDVTDQWRDDLVAFVLGCSFTFEHALAAAGIPLRHLEQGRTVPMYETSRSCAPAGPFRGPLVVSMRPVPGGLVPRAVRVSARFPRAHGAPVHVGAPGSLGIDNLARPEHGEPVDIADGDVPVFWACGVTPQAAVRHAAPDLAITHAPGHMLITDLPHTALDEG